jgi:hypothetical protein
MDLVHGTWMQGRIILDEPGTWPDGTRVKIAPLAGEVSIGL